MSNPLARDDEAARPDSGFTALQKWRLVAILILAAILRLAQLYAQSLSSDEVKDLAMARGGVAALQESEDRFPPLYHALLGLWLKAVPIDWMGRGFSALCGVLTVAAMAGLGRVVAGAPAGVWAAALTAIAPLPVWYSVEARAYALYMLLATVALWQFTAALQGDRAQHWAGFAAASIAGAYTHYYFGIFIGLAGIAWLASKPRGSRLRRGLVAFAVVAAATAPSLWLLKRDLDHPWGYARTSEFSLPALGYTYFSYLSGYTLGPSLRALHTLGSRDAAIAAAPWVAIVGIAAGTLFALAIFREPPTVGRRRIAWFVAFGLAPAAVIGLVSVLAGFGYNVRHAVWAFAPLATLIAAGVAYGRPRWLAGVAAATLVAAFAVAQLNRLTTFDHANEDMRGVAEIVTAVDTPRHTFVLSGYMSGALAAYLPQDWPAYSLPDAAADERAADLAIAEIRRRTTPGRPLWLVYTREFHGDPDGELLAALQREFGMELYGRLAGAEIYSGTAP